MDFHVISKTKYHIPDNRRPELYGRIVEVDDRPKFLAFRRFWGEIWEGLKVITYGFVFQFVLILSLFSAVGVVMILYVVLKHLAGV